MTSIHFKRRALIPIALLLLFTSACRAQTPERSLLAISKADHMLSVVDPVSLKTLARLPLGADPHEVVADADGKLAYVTIYGGGSLHEINVLDLLTQKPLASFDTRPLLGPHDITFVLGKVWFTAEGSKSVGRYDPVSGKLDWSMGTGQDRTHMLYVTADAKNIFTTNMGSGTVSVLSGSIQSGQSPSGSRRENWSQTIVETAKGCEGFDVSPNGNELWTASSDDGNISIIDLPSMKRVALLAANVPGANRLKFTPDGKLVFVSSLQTGEVTIFDVASRAPIKRLKLGKGAAGILMDAEDFRVFVACSPDNYIAIIDLQTLEVTGHLEVGGVPDGMAWAVRAKNQK